MQPLVPSSHEEPGEVPARSCTRYLVCCTLYAAVGCVFAFISTALTLLEFCMLVCVFGCVSCLLSGVRCYPSYRCVRLAHCCRLVLTPSTTVQNNHPPYTSLTPAFFAPLTAEGVRCRPRRLQRLSRGRRASVLQGGRDQAAAVIGHHHLSRVTSRGA